MQNDALFVLCMILQDFATADAVALTLIAPLQFTILVRK